MNCASAQIELDKISDAAKALMRREQDVERLCSSFGVALRYIGSHAPRENNQPMVSRDWAEQRIHECIVASPCRFCLALNLGLRAISLSGSGAEIGDTSWFRNCQTDYINFTQICLK